jgi:hypothetical protein
VSAGAGALLFEDDAVQIQKVSPKFRHGMGRDPVRVAKHCAGIIERDDPMIPQDLVLDLSHEAQPLRLVERIGEFLL